LLRQGSVFVIQDNPRHGLQEHAVVVGDLFEPPDENATGLSSICASIPEAIRPMIWSVQGLAVDRNIFV